MLNLHSEISELFVNYKKGVVFMADRMTSLGIPEAQGLPRKITEPLYLVTRWEIERVTSKDPSNFGLQSDHLHVDPVHSYGDRVWILNRDELCLLAERAKVVICSVRQAKVRGEKYYFTVRFLSVEGKSAKYLDVAMVAEHHFEPQPFQCSTDDWDGDANRSMFQVLAEHLLMPVVKADIVISVPHKRIREYIEDFREPFRVYIWSSVTEAEKLVATPKRMWGHEVACTDSSFPPSGRGITISDDRGHAVAELFPCALYIHHDLVHHGDISALHIFRKILEEVALNVKDWGGRKKWVVKAKQLEAAQVEEKYLASCSTLFEANRVRISRDALKAEELVEHNKKRFADAIAVHETLKLRARALQSIDFDSARLQSDITALKTLPQVSSVIIRGNKLLVETKPLVCLDTKTNTHHRIGRCTITILLDSGDVLVRADSSQAREDSLMVPHTYSSGVFVWGEHQLDVIEYLARSEMSVVVDFVVQKLLQVSPLHSGYRDIGKYRAIAKKTSHTKTMERLHSASVALP
jgi:hypothetical protein